MGWKKPKHIKKTDLKCIAAYLIQINYHEIFQSDHEIASGLNINKKPFQRVDGKYI